MCVLTEIIWEITRSPTDREMDLNMGSEIVPCVWQNMHSELRISKGNLFWTIHDH